MVSESIIVKQRDIINGSHLNCLVRTLNIAKNRFIKSTPIVV